jgi:steroid delta-isomerase-like uncharacterized protein
MSRPAPIALDQATAPYAAALLRVTLGIVFVAHALLKLLVLTLPATATFFVEHGFPGWTAYAVFAAELLGGVALVAGFHTRVIALALVPVLMGAFTVHWPNGWYFGAPHGGWEYIAVLVAALIVQAGLGDGRFALTTGLRSALAIPAPSRRWPTWLAVLILGVVMTADGSAHARRRASSLEPHDGSTLARRYFEEVWNQGKVDVLDELLSPAYVNHTPSAGQPRPGPDGLKPIVLAIRRAFPDLHYRIEDVIVSADAVVIRTTMTGTHEGDLFGLPPTHRKIRVTQIQIERVRNGRIVEHWRVTDELSLMRQLGALP